MAAETNTKNRGFASMNVEKQREIARKGGRAAHEKGTAHEFTSDEARAAGRKGGERVSADRRHMAEIGRMGGRSSAGRRATRGSTDQSAPEEGAGDGGDGDTKPGMETASLPASRERREMDDED
jgi:general stress protein YciG